MIRRLSIVAGWLALAFIAYATLSPIEDRPAIAAAGPQLEHFAAFALMGLAFSLGYPKRTLLVVAVVMASALGLELLQLLTPDRHGRLLDALVKAAGGLCGVGVGSLGQRLWRDHVHRIKGAPGSAQRPN
jgi:VanZ family protein